MLMGEVNNSEQREHLRQEVLQVARGHPQGTGFGSEHRGSTGTGREGEGTDACSEGHEHVMVSGPAHLLWTYFILSMTEASRDNEGAPGNFISVIHSRAVRFSKYKYMKPSSILNYI